MDLRKIKKLIEMLQESDLNEIEVKEGEESVRINRKKDNVIHSAVAPNVISAPVLQNNDTNQVASEQDDELIGLSHIPSPMVGTFYRKPSPDKAPYVEVGQMVKKGDTVCIIEAMKMMNQVKSEFDGKIISINVGDGEPVEFGQELISIEES
jgi:acetyl-CoA carboxylase biotin carboxyl carrier protein